MGRPVSLPAVVNSPGRQRTGCQESKAVDAPAWDSAWVDEVINEDDTSLQKNGVTLLIDPMSLQYLGGAEIDYQEGAEGAQFVIKNPNATSTCGCGSSFSA